MNKRKRALALGLAATQLTALSAAVAPLTVFAAGEMIGINQGKVNDSVTFEPISGTGKLDTEFQACKQIEKYFSDDTFVSFSNSDDELPLTLGNDYKLSFDGVPAYYIEDQDGNITGVVIQIFCELTETGMEKYYFSLGGGTGWCCYFRVTVPVEKIEDAPKAALTIKSDKAGDELNTIKPITFSEYSKAEFDALDKDAQEKVINDKKNDIIDFVKAAIEFKRVDEDDTLLDVNTFFNFNLSPESYRLLSYLNVDIAYKYDPDASEKYDLVGNVECLGGRYSINVPVKFAADTSAVKSTVTIGEITGGEVTADKTAEVTEGETVTLTIAPASGKQLGTLSVKTDKAEIATTKVNDTTYTFTMPTGAVTVTATFTDISSGSGSSSSRPSGGSGGSGVSPTRFSTMSSAINSALNGETVTVPDNTATIYSVHLQEAAEKDLTLVVPIDQTFTRSFKPSEMGSTDTYISMSVSAGAAVSSQALGKIEGHPVSDVMTFETRANGLGKSAKLIAATSVKPTAAAPMFANLYRIKDNGDLEFIAAARVGEDGKTVLPMSDAGKFALLVSDETKQPGDINNDCAVKMDDIQAALRLYVDTIGTITRAQNFKLDHDGSGVVDIADIQKLLLDWVNGKFG